MDTGGILEKTNRNRKRMQLYYNFSRRTFDIKIYDSNHRKKITAQDDERKIPGTQKDHRSI